MADAFVFWSRIPPLCSWVNVRIDIIYIHIPPGRVVNEYELGRMDNHDERHMVQMRDVKLQTLV